MCEKEIIKKYLRILSIRYGKAILLVYVEMRIQVQIRVRVDCLLVN